MSEPIRMAECSRCGEVYFGGDVNGYLEVTAADGLRCRAQCQRPSRSTTAPPLEQEARP